MILDDIGAVGEGLWNAVSRGFSTGSISTEAAGAMWSRKDCLAGVDS